MKGLDVAIIVVLLFLLAMTAEVCQRMASAEPQTTVCRSAATPAIMWQANGSSCH